MNFTLPLLMSLSVAVYVTATSGPASAACSALGLSHCPQPFDAVLPRPEDMLTWDRPTRVVGFRNTYRMYSGDVIHTLGGTAFPLPLAAQSLPPIHYFMDDQAHGLNDYLHREKVTGLLIIKDGHRVYEYYGSGNTERTLWTSRSVAKSIVSILVGMALKDGSIGSVTDPITRYLPELKDTDWAEITLRDLLQHTSGMQWNERYADPTSDFAQMNQCEASPAPYDCVLKLIRSLKKRPGVKPGELWSYNTGGAWLVGLVLERATGMTIAQYCETRLWSRLAMEQDGVWEALVKGKADMGGHGFNATLRDWGRFGLFVANGGKLAHGEELLPRDWITQSTAWSTARNSVTAATPQGQYGYQWWFLGVDPQRSHLDGALLTARQTFWAEGIYGQAIAINRAERLVMVQWSTWQDAATPDALYDEQALFFNAISHALHGAPAKPVPTMKPR